MKRKMTISLVTGTAFSAVTFYLAFRNVPFDALAAYLAAIDYLWLLPAAAAVVLSFVLRAVRWRIILETSRRVDFWRAFHPLMTGFMINCILPGRLGEIARPAILKQREKVPFATGLATVAAERVFDIALLLGLFVIVTASVHVDPQLDIPFGDYHLNRDTLAAVAKGMIQLCLVLIAGIVLVIVERSRRLINRAILATPARLYFLPRATRERLTSTVAVRLTALVNGFAEGFALARHPGKLLACAGLTVGVWLLLALSWYLFALGCPGIGLSPLEITAVMVIVCFFIALPSVPGFWGLWEAGGVFALSIFGVSLHDAAGYTLANHALQMFPVILIGLASALITGVNIWRVSFAEKV